MRRIALRSALMLAALAATAGCAAPTSGNPNSGYTNDIANLLVKIPALRGDPCRGAQAGQLYGNCGRFATEVANTIAALRASLPADGADVDTLQNAVNTYQRLGCDSLAGTPDAQQATQCPRELTAIGAELDRLGTALDAIPPSG